MCLDHFLRSKADGHWRILPKSPIAGPLPRTLSNMFFIFLCPHFNFCDALFIEVTFASDTRSVENKQSSPEL